MPLRLVFMGTPEFALPTLVEIVGRGHDVAAVYTRAPKRAGRGMDLQPSPIEREARRFGLEVLTPSTLRTDEAAATFRAHGADAAVVVAYGLILPPPVLAAAPLGCFNLHASLLPRWRGAAPINRAIMAGDRETGVMAMKMDEGLDTGPIAMAERVPIGHDMTAGELHDVLAPLGGDLMVQVLAQLERHELKLQPQRTMGITYADKIDKAQARIDWKWSWRVVRNHCRGLSPSPGAWFEIAKAGAPLRVSVLRAIRGEGSGPPGTVLDNRLTIACGEGAVRIVELRREGRKPMKAEEFLHGTRLPAGTQVR
jgi:methionyl-tRNA formyltransferase